MIIYYAIKNNKLNFVEKLFWEEHEYMADSGDIVYDISEKLTELGLSEVEECVFDMNDIAIEEIQDFMADEGYEFMQSLEFDEFIQKVTGNL